MKFQELVDWVLSVKNLLDPKSPHVHLFDKILTILSGDDLRESPAQQIEKIREHLADLISKKFILKNLPQNTHTPGEIYEKLEREKESRKILEYDISNLDRIPTANVKGTIAVKVVSPNEIQRHMDAIANAIKQNDIDQAIYHLFSFDTLLNKLKPIIGRGNKIATKTEIYDFNLDDWIKFISAAYPELKKNNKTELLKNGAVLSEAIQKAYMDLVDNDDASKDHVPMFSVISTMLKIFAGVNKLNFNDKSIEIDLGRDVTPLEKRLKSEMPNYEMLTRYLSLKTPIEKVLSKVDELFPDEDKRNHFKRKLYKYQIEHAKEVFDAQVGLTEQSERPAVASASSSNDGSSNQSKSEENIQSKIAYNFLKNIQEIIISTQWIVGKKGGTKIYDKEGKYINTVPKNMLKILNVIQKAYIKAGTIQSREVKAAVWLKAFNVVAQIGVDAANNKPFSFFGMGKRDAGTQEFYNQFKTAFANASKCKTFKST